jgi:hypothetical protein
MSDKENIDKIDELLDEQIAKFPSGNAIGKAAKDVPIKLINTDIEFITENGHPTGLLLCGLAEVDGVIYGAIFDTIKLTGHVEELHMTPGRTGIKSMRLIKDPTEWSVLVNFFQSHNVWESRRIYNWMISYRLRQQLAEPVIDDKVKQLANDINKRVQRIKGRNAPLTTEIDLYKSTKRMLRRARKKKRKE